jgi:hypothetical protein
MMTMAYYDAKHESGKEWLFCVPNPKGKHSQEVISKRADLFVRNYCHKNFLRVDVVITCRETGETRNVVDTYVPHHSLT